jgi:hypothetical protein
MTAGSPKAYFDQDDGHGRVLKVLARDDGKAAVQIKDAAGSGMTLGSWIADPVTAPDLCRAIFEAAGQVPPVTIGRRELPLDLAEVEDVAAAIREAFQPDGTPPSDWERKAARAALGRMRERETTT